MAIVIVLSTTTAKILNSQCSSVFSYSNIMQGHFSECVPASVMFSSAFVFARARVNACIQHAACVHACMRACVHAWYKARFSEVSAGAFFVHKFSIWHSWTHI